MVRVRVRLGSTWIMGCVKKQLSTGTAALKMWTVFALWNSDFHVHGHTSHAFHAGRCKSAHQTRHQVHAAYAGQRCRQHAGSAYMIRGMMHSLATAFSCYVGGTRLSCLYSMRKTMLCITPAPRHLAGPYRQPCHD